LKEEIEYRVGKVIPTETLQQLFRKEKWSDFLDLAEVQLHLDTALYLVSAWNKEELVGYARLQGDGKIWVEISDVLVKSEYQARGIGTELVRFLVAYIKKIDPYFIQVEPISDREVHLYRKFGFQEIREYRRMELVTEKLIRKIAQVRETNNDL
jgi:ribosomal protein S18 acetylase RimI-like enzyme